jgi:excisionase family DNA binding protein
MASTFTTDREWLSLHELTEYASVSVRTLRQWLNRTTDGLPAVRVGGKILVRRSQFDTWLERHRMKPDSEIDLESIVSSVLRDVR